MSSIRREERILNLLAVLLAARSPVPFSTIRGVVSGYDDPASEEALEKRFDRDKADLRKLGVPLSYVAEDDFGRSGYRIEKERFFLDEVRFTVEEGIVLAALTRSVEAGRGDALAENLRSALAKIGVDSPLTGAFRDSVAEQQLLDARVSAGGAEEPGPLPALAEALAARRPVRFVYYSLGADRVGERSVEPFGVAWHHGQWYLVGRDREKGEERVFRTSRIRGGVEVLPGPEYEIPDDFDLRSRIEVAPWLFARGEPRTARVRFRRDVAWMIGENLRPGQTFEPDEDGGGVLALPMTDEASLIRWVAEYGPAAEILEPEELRDRMVAHLRDLVSRYER